MSDALAKSDWERLSFRLFAVGVMFAFPGSLIAAALQLGWLGFCMALTTWGVFLMLLSFWAQPDPETNWNSGSGSSPQALAAKPTTPPPPK